MMGEKESAIVPAAAEAVTPIVVPPLEPEVIRQHFDKIQLLKRKLIDPETDMIKIGSKPYILKSGWRKLAFAFNLSDEIVREEKEERGDETIYRIWAKVTAPNGRFVVAVGCASSKEREFTHEAHDPYALAATRSKNRAISDIIGLGEVSAEEMLGQKEEGVMGGQWWKQANVVEASPVEPKPAETKPAPATTPPAPATIPEGASPLKSSGRTWGYFKKTEWGGELYFDPPLDLANPKIKSLVETFLYGRVLDGMKKAKSDKGFTFGYTPIVEGGKLLGISFAGDPEAMDGETTREICSSAGWTAARAAEKV
jgi:hypothetical protein